MEQFWFTVSCVLFIFLLIEGYLMMLAVRQVIFMREDVEVAKDVEHAKCIGALTKFVGDEFAAQVLTVAAEDYDSVEEKERLLLIQRQYHPDGPSVPARWMLNRAGRIRVLSDWGIPDVQE